MFDTFGYILPTHKVYSSGDEALAAAHEPIVKHKQLEENVKEKLPLIFGQPHIHTDHGECAALLTVSISYDNFMRLCPTDFVNRLRCLATECTHPPTEIRPLENIESLDISFVFVYQFVRIGGE